MPDPRSAGSFDVAAASVRGVEFRSDFIVHEIPAPTGLAPEAIALAGDVRPDDDGESRYGTGRFILLHDPDEPEAWGGPWRIVCFAQAPLEPEIGTDPLVADVAWSWLIDALESRNAPYSEASGTATRTLSKGFGALAPEGEGSQVELRASWTPQGAFDQHVSAWAEFVCMLAGLPPGSEHIQVFRARGTTSG